jgi:hypothetical protein
LGHDGVFVGWTVFFALLGIGAGAAAAGVATVVLSISTGMSDFSKGFFFLLWAMFAVAFFAWAMLLRERFRAFGRMRRWMKAEMKRSEDPFYDPPKFPWRKGTWTPRAPEASLDPDELDK